MALQTGPYYSRSLDHPEDGISAAEQHVQYPELDSSMAPMYPLIEGALHVHHSTQDNANRHLAGLMQATTVTTTEDANYTEASSTLGAQRSTRRSRSAVTESGLTITTAEQEFAIASSPSASSRKRRRQGDLQERQYVPQSTLCRDATPSAPALKHQDVSPQEILDCDAPIAGVQSAAALFRSPSSSSKKYTRPPMSKLYTSLELSPENFLHLQATAKSYMLDPGHPERRDCVGQRGKGDSELVKMRLWNCVARFLDDEGHGQCYFGEEVPGDGGAKRTMSWPRDRSKIIGAVIPLLRRMVTNERQRQYAVESRKGINSGKQERTTNSEVPLTAGTNAHHDAGDEVGLVDSHTKQASQPSPVVVDEEVLSARSLVGATCFNESLKLQFNILRDGHRVGQRHDAVAEECPDRHEIYAQILQRGDVASLEGIRVRVLLPQGLVAVDSDNDWLQALSVVQRTAWMDGEVKVLIELPTMDQ